MIPVHLTALLPVNNVFSLFPYHISVDDYHWQNVNESLAAKGCWEM